MKDRDRIAEIIRNARMCADPLSQVGYAEADALLANGVMFVLTQDDIIEEFLDRFYKKVFPLGTFHDLNYPINAKAIKFACDNIAKEMKGKDK